MKLLPGWKWRGMVIVLLFHWLVPLSRGREPGAGVPPPGVEAVVLPKSVPDPVEPMNRVIWEVNKDLMIVVIEPSSRLYRVVIPKPFRNGINHFSKNLTYPGRLINNVLQGKWTGARDETYRFLCNSTVGVGGLWDVADKWKIPRSDADFGQTFGRWGWEPHCYLMLPVFGPSSERDALGLLVDTAANPLTYIDPYTEFSIGARYNGLSDTVSGYVRFSRAELDPYSEMQYAWTFLRANKAANFEEKGPKDGASLETIESVFFSPKNPEFPNRGKTRTALIPATGRKLPFTFWLQPGQAPVVYVVPGLGGHRLGDYTMALAELMYHHGFSVVCVSSVFNHEFMENASTAAMPAYLKVDGHDLHVALTEVDRRLNALYPQRLGARALAGCSMGALQSLYIAATEATNQPSLVHFERYVAIDTPVRFSQGVDKLDEFYQAPLKWPAAERAANIENTFLKAASLKTATLAPGTDLPFSAIESEFLIGVVFRLTLRDAIFSSQRRNNQGILKQPLNGLRRDPVLQEILQYSYHDYFERFASSYYESRGVAPPAVAELEKAGDLRSYEAGLRANPNVRIILNRNDFLLSAEDLAWLQGTLKPENFTIFERGGHLGNLSRAEVQQAIVKALEGLK